MCNYGLRARCSVEYLWVLQMNSDFKVMDNVSLMVFKDLTSATNRSVICALFLHFRCPFMCLQVCPPNLCVVSCHCCCPALLLPPGWLDFQPSAEARWPQPLCSGHLLVPMTGCRSNSTESQYNITRFRSLFKHLLGWKSEMSENLPPCWDMLDQKPLMSHGNFQW